MRVIITPKPYLGKFEEMDVKTFLESEDALISDRGNTTIIPRIGDRVALFYTPFPVVKEVVYDYGNSIIWVLVE